MESHLIRSTVTKHTLWKECFCVQFPIELHLTAGSIDYQWSGWCSAAALIEPPSSRWMFDLSSGRNGKWSDLLFPPTSCLLLSSALTFPRSVTEAAEGHPDWLTMHFLPPVSTLFAAKVWEVRQARGHLMKQGDRWSEEWWRNERWRRTGHQNERVTFCGRGRNLQTEEEEE